MSKEYAAAFYLAGDITLLSFNELYALQVLETFLEGEMSDLQSANGKPLALTSAICTV